MIQNIVKKIYVWIFEKKIRIFAFLLLCIFILYKILYVKNFHLNSSNFETVKVGINTIKKSVSATGTITPINIISVGAQVSGMVNKIYTDFNKPVKAGELLAEIDKTLLLEDLKSANARYMQAEARFNLAKLDKKRNEELFKAGYIAKLEMEKTDTDYITSQAIMIGAKADKDRAKRNLSYALIKSPVSGVVISKNVEEGQTLASSFSSPTLFTIAEDLSRMKISASITEADIGSITEGQEVSFSVDAFPYKKFSGKVTQIRLNPVSEQNVVIYNVIIEINNKDKLLLPGMTAYVEIDTLKKENVKTIDSYVLQFKPDNILLPFIDYPGMGAIIVNEAKKNDKKIDTNMGIGVVVKLDKNLNNSKDSFIPTLPAGEAYIYKYISSTNRIMAVKIKLGISNGILTEIISPEIKEGDEFIFDFKDTTKK